MSNSAFHLLNSSSLFYSLTNPLFSTRDDQASKRAKTGTGRTVLKYTKACTHSSPASGILAIVFRGSAHPAHLFRHRRAQDGTAQLIKDYYKNSAYIPALSGNLASPPENTLRQLAAIELRKRIAQKSDELWINVADLAR